MINMSDRRAQLKSQIRKNPALAKIFQWVFDPAYTPFYLIDQWVREQDGYILNFGAGSRKFPPNVLNLDIEPFANVLIVNTCDRVPFKNNTCDGVLLEYVLEHVEDPRDLLKEVFRVLKPGAPVLATVPFKQNYHACPNDYWRFTHEGLEKLLASEGFTDIKVEVYGGPVSAFIDAKKEFLATIFSFGIPALYDYLSQLFIIPFIPLRYLDIWLRKLSVAKYTAFSFMVVARKPGTHVKTRILDLSPTGVDDLLWVPQGYKFTYEKEMFWIKKI